MKLRRASRSRTGQPQLRERIRFASLVVVLTFSLGQAFGQSVILNEDFEDSVLDSRLSIGITGTFSSNPGIKSFGGFGSTRALGYGRSTCALDCFDNFATVLTINLGSPIFVAALSFKEMEQFGNFGSTGLIYVNGVRLTTNMVDFGREPHNDGISDTNFRTRNIAINQTVTTIMLRVWDITDQSEIYIDDIQVTTNFTLSRVGAFAQIASGGGWKTTITLMNLSSSPVSATIRFYGDNGSPLGLPLAFPQSGSSGFGSFHSVVVNARASIVIETEASGPSISTGWADVEATAPLRGYAIFRLRSPGLADSEGTVVLDTQLQSSLVLPYDNTSGFETGLALGSQNVTPTNAVVIIRDDTGAQLQTSQINLTGFGHTAFFVSSLFPVTANRRGMIEVQNVGTITGVGLRFNSTGSFTSVPITR